MSFQSLTSRDSLTLKPVPSIPASCHHQACSSSSQAGMSFQVIKSFTNSLLMSHHHSNSSHVDLPHRSRCSTVPEGSSRIAGQTEDTTSTTLCSRNNSQMLCKRININTPSTSTGPAADNHEWKDEQVVAQPAIPRDDDSGSKTSQKIQCRRPQ